MSAFLTGKGWFAAMALLSAVVFVAANLLLQPLLAPARVDFTDRKLYTLSPATRAALENLAEPVDLTLVYTRRVGQDYPAIRAYAARVRELLDLYEARSGGKLRVTEIDPEPFSEAEDRALSAGITAIETQGTDPLYFGLIGINTVDNERIIPFLSPDREGSLEYDLTRMIARLDNPAPARVGLVTSLAGMRGDGRETGYTVLQDLARSVTVEPVAPDFVSLPADLDALILAHPHEFNDYQLWVIDQFLLREGRLIWIADPAAKAGAAAGPMNVEETNRASDFGRLGRHWGLELSKQAVADAANALPVQTDSAGGRSAVVGQPLFIAAPPANMSRTDTITAPLARPVNLGAPGAIRGQASEGLVLTPLIRTGPAPAYIDAEAAIGDIPPDEVITAYEAREAPLTLAARLTGQFTSAFPDGAPPLPLTGDSVLDELTRAAAAEMPPHIADSVGQGAVILIADSDFLDDGFYINPANGAAIAANSSFLLNAVDALTGVEGLMMLRSRAPSQRPMSRVERMRSAAEARFFEEQMRLEERLAATEARLEELQAEAAEAGGFNGDLEAALEPVQRIELQRLRERIVETRSRLRAIERDFRRDIDGLEATLKTINIWGGPLLVILLGLGVWLVRRRVS